MLRVGEGGGMGVVMFVMLDALAGRARVWPGYS